ncbi:DNA-binding response regulator [Mycolicibacterium aichiense]|uniref:response regulator transcription factor n=1 Tax=Mycolicibacterium aichiense TaxID=1799 RepID=UPI000E03814A|nr:response regulator transcription factor [Mycolicibacterium aichiense]MCV7021085.1 response regulator transcription factor [Mycolicibacterium aichiense]STZ24995.1 two component LuxR family transcriptional regulator [Mycolicibacterium aichiense]
MSVPDHSPLRVVVIDDHDAIHDAVRIWCRDAEPAATFVAAFFSTEQFLSDVGSEVDVVVFDLEQDGRRIDFAGLSRVIERGYRVVVYSYQSANEVILRCLEIGALSYIAKSENKQHLIDAITAAHADEPYVGPRMAAAMFANQDAGRPNLTSREMEVLIAWFQTESKDLVAQRLFISPSTVRTHLQRVRAKYASVGRQAQTKSALVARAIQDGIIAVDDL